MAYANELLELAQELDNLHPDHPHQPSLRRAVSTAYYALFHLLISEATANWQRPELRWRNTIAMKRITTPPENGI